LLIAPGLLLPVIGLVALGGLFYLHRWLGARAVGS